MSWVRLWNDMPTDPKWRVVARKSGRPLSEVIAVFAFMLLNAGANASERNEHDTERGVLKNWSDEDVAAALDVEPANVAAIREAMQGKTLEGDKLTGWEKRQPKREDGSAERAKQWRERKRTQANAEKRPDSDTDSEKEVVQSCASATPAAALPEKFMDRMIEAAGPCLANACNAQGLLTESTPVMWLENGCDFDRDVLPTLRAAAVSRKGKRIATWAYFTAMIAESRAKRLAGLPAFDVGKPKASATYLPTPRRRELTDEERERIAMEYAN